MFFYRSPDAQNFLRDGSGLPQFGVRLNCRDNVGKDLGAALSKKFLLI
jgi:hypothetical protein